MVKNKKQIKITDEQIAQIKEKFWEQKREEIGGFIIFAILASIAIFAFLPAFGLMTAQTFEQMGKPIASLNAFISMSPAWISSYDTISYWNCIFVGFVDITVLALALLIIYGIITIIKMAFTTWIECNLDKAIKETLG